MNVNVKKLHPNAVIPSYALPGDGGMDLTAVAEELTPDAIIYHIGLAFEIPEGHIGLIFPRSSIYKKDLTLANSVGVLDSSFRGELKVIFKPNGGFVKQRYKVGDRVAQLIILPYPTIELTEVEELSETNRGNGGFGSTGA